MNQAEDRNLPTPADVLDLLSTAVLVIDETLMIRYMNSAAEAIFGTSKQQSLGTNIRELLYDIGSGDGAAAFTELLAIFESEQSITRRGAELHTRQGGDITADLTVSLDLQSRRLIIELQPMNRLLKINREDHALASQETTRRLVRGLAHEIKNPLGGLRGAAQLLERELDHPEQREYTRIIIDEADRLTELVDRLLSPNTKPRIESVNIHRILEHVVNLVDAEMPGRLGFIRDYDPSLPDIQCDETQIIQAVLNIVRNAAQILDDERQRITAPEITLRTRVVRSFTIGTSLHRLVAQIDIIDNGPGVPADMLDSIFVPMISGRPQGTGLGLAITQSVISRHHGVIECTSRPGKTCFSVFLPLEVTAHG